MTLENNKELLAEKAKSVFADGFHCSQAVLSVFAEELGIDEVTAKRLGGCFGAGMCTGEVCGAAVGALMAIGLKFGHTKSSDLAAKQLTNQKTLEFLTRFRQANGAVLCRELLGRDVRKPEDVSYLKEHGVFLTFCPKMVDSAVRIAADLINSK